jgi:hypothetical protein
MATDQGPVVQSALLRSELIRLRKESGQTQEQVAEALDWSPSKLIRVEGGRDLDATYIEYVGYEAGAAFIRQFQSGYVPGLLQTQAYAEVVTTNSVDAVRSTPTVKLRLQRQSELARRSAPPRQYYVIDEAVIRRHVGIRLDPAIMPRQLLHIAERAQTEELITVRVIPFDTGAHRGLSGPFTLLEFDGPMPDLLYLDAGREATLITGTDPRIAEYADDFEILLESALSATDSIEFIREAAEAMS